MADLGEIDTTSVHLFENGGDPVTDAIHVSGGDTEGSSTGVVNIGLEEHVVNLSVQVDTTISGVQSTGDPGNPGMLQVVGSSTPGSVKPDEESHLLTAIKVVDDSSNRVTRDNRVGSEASNLLGGGGVADSSRVVPETRSTDTSSGAQTRGGEIADIGERDVLLNTGVTASTAHSRSTVVGTGVNIILDHTNTVRELVGIQLVPLVGGQGTLVTGSAVVIADLRSNDDTTEVSTGAGVQSRQINTGLGNDQGGERNTIGVEAGRSNTSGGSVLGNHKNVGSNIGIGDCRGSGRSRDGNSS